MSSRRLLPQHSLQGAAMGRPYCTVASAQTFDNDSLINSDTGEIDEAHLRETAAARAKARYGDGVTDLDVAFFMDKLRTIALTLRAQRRKDFGLPDDTVHVSCTPFGRQVEGALRSTF
jgi:hypothetical protein